MTLSQLISAATPAITPVRAKRRRAVKPRVRRSKAAPAPSGRGTHQVLRYVTPAGTRRCHTYRPAGLRKTTAAPLVMALHGCRQGPDEFAAATRLNQLADRHGFLVVYPEQTAVHNLQRCWNWHNESHQIRGHGEPAILAGIAQKMTAERTRWRVDPQRIYVAGLSAGGSMALVLGAIYPDVFAAVGAHSATPYGSASNISTALRAMGGRSQTTTLDPGDLAPAPTIVFQGGRDHTVHPANASHITTHWLEMRERLRGENADLPRISRQHQFPGQTAAGVAYTITRWYATNGRVLLESWVIDRLGHAWSGGRKGIAYSDPEGPRATTEMWRFLSRHTLPT